MWCVLASLHGQIQCLSRDPVCFPESEWGVTEISANWKSMGVRGVYVEGIFAGFFFYLCCQEVPPGIRRMGPLLNGSEHLNKHTFLRWSQQGLRAQAVLGQKLLNFILLLQSPFFEYYRSCTSLLKITALKLFSFLIYP